jgi:hypothetical protein
MRSVGEILRARGVAAVYLAHGTFVGPDALGVLAELGRVLPATAHLLRRVVRRVVETFTGDAGNYTESYARQFQAAINRGGDYPIAVRLFHWSSENHHLGRADGAVRLIDELASLELERGQRLLLWGHSHAGNVFALMTNLLAGNREAVDRFFQAADVYYRWPMLGWVDIPVWNRVRELLSRQRPGLRETPLDLVTFGTPVRYGWDSSGYARLLHFINRRPVEGHPEDRASFPLRLKDVLTAAEGDYVQQLGIAGTNVTPSLFSWRAWLADRRLHRLLQADWPESLAQERFQAGTIIPDEGTTLLVDYGHAQGGIAEHHAGHAVYTRKEWLLFHAEQIARQFYQTEARRVA